MVAETTFSVVQLYFYSRNLNKIFIKPFIFLFFINWFKDFSLISWNGELNKNEKNTQHPPNIQ